jgi:hypothetical protein
MGVSAMATPEPEGIIQLSVPVQPLRRHRSRLGEPTVRIELVVIDSNGQLGKELLRRQASAVKEALQWFADHPPTDEPDHHDGTGKYRNRDGAAARRAVSLPLRSYLQRGVGAFGKQVLAYRVATEVGEPDLQAGCVPHRPGCYAKESRHSGVAGIRVGWRAEHVDGAVVGELGQALPDRCDRQGGEEVRVARW